SVHPRHLLPFPTRRSSDLRARIPVPARVPVGNYRAETYLISKGRVIAVASRDVEIRKAGFERFVALAAQRHGFLYGLSAVLLSRSEEHTSELQSRENLVCR